MTTMFYDASLFDANLSSWDVSQVEFLDGMFYRAKAFSGVGIDQWSTSSASTATFMFYDAFMFDANLTTWDVSFMKDFQFMFSGASRFQGVGLSSWDTSSAVYLNHMFKDSPSFNADLRGWSVGNVIDFSGMFYNTTSFRGVGIDEWDVRSAIIMNHMFSYAMGISDVNLSQWDVSSVQDMARMFEGAKSFQGRGLDRWNTSSVQYIVSFLNKSCSMYPMLKPKNVLYCRGKKIIILLYCFIFYSLICSIWLRLSMRIYQIGMFPNLRIW
jgi:surface protein